MSRSGEVGYDLKQLLKLKSYNKKTKFYLRALGFEGAEGCGGFKYKVLWGREGLLIIVTAENLSKALNDQNF